MVAKIWNSHAAIDSRGAALGQVGDGARRWSNREDFVRTGRNDVQAFAPSNRRFARALDYGCGPGRHLPALCEIADEVFAFDLSQGMRQEADEVAKTGLNVTILEPDTFGASTDPYDLIWCRLVLQHQQSEASIREELSNFSGLLADDGVAVVQIIHRRSVRLPGLRGILGALRWRAKHGSLARIPMTCIPESRFNQHLATVDLQVQTSLLDGAAKGWESKTHTLVRRTTSRSEH